MPPLGEAPITSFFRVNSQSRKRTNTNSGSHITKRRKGEESSLQVEPSSSKVPRKRIDEHFPVASGSLLSKKHILQTPIHKNSRTDKEQLKTPPLTNEIPRLLRNNTPQPQSALNQVAMDKTGGSFLPSPVTVPRRKPIRRISHRVETIPMSKITNRRNSPALDFGKEGSESFVPSSQSQPELSFISNNKGKTAIQHSPRIISDVATPGRTNSLTVGPNAYSTDTDVEDEVIPSSQSQLPLAIDRTPTKFKRSSTTLPPRAPPTFEYIPSSQSQEIDLAIRSDEDIPLPNLTKTPYPVRNSPIKATGNLSRTLSDEMFPVPIQHSLFDDIFQAEDIFTAQQDTVLPNPNNIVEEESVTESESENEWMAKPTTAEPLEIQTEHASPPPPLSSSVASPEHCSQEDADDERELESQITHSIGSTPEDTLTILSQPLAVKDFEDMFGDYDDGSYPPDFPMSLRS